MINELKKNVKELENLIDNEPEVGQYLMGLIQDNLDNENERLRKRKYGAE